MKKLLITGIFLVCMVGMVFSQENYSSWTWYRTITLNTKASGANITENQLNFPILVRLSAKDSAVFAKAKTTGADIRFSKMNGTHLSYQIEQWDATAKTAAIWVKMDTVFSNDSSPRLMMRWGNASAADSSKGAAVFDTSNGYQGVFHFNSAAGSNETDATKNGFVAVPTASPTDAEGMIGRAKSFDGSSQYYVLNNSKTGALNFSTPYTLSAWIKPTVVEAQYVVSKTGGQYMLYFTSSGYNTDIPLTIYNVSTDGTTQRVFSPNTGSTYSDAWHHVVGVVTDASNLLLYIDGSLASSSITTGSITWADSGSVFIGAQTYGYGFFTGIIDELEMSNVARSDNWVLLSYKNQQPIDSLTSFGSIMSGDAIKSPAHNNYTSATTLGHTGVLEVYMANGSRVMALPYGPSSTRTALLNTASKKLAKGYYTYRFNGTGVQANIVGKLIK
jgi:hypothetical protein